MKGNVIVYFLLQNGIARLQIKAFSLQINLLKKLVYAIQLVFCLFAVIIKALLQKAKLELRARIKSQFLGKNFSADQRNEFCVKFKVWFL